jgi:uncharacterized protein
MEASDTRCTWAEAGNGRTVVARLLRDSDLVTGLIDICRQSGLRTAAIASCVGSLRQATFCWTARSDRTKRGTERTAPIVLEGPIEFLAGQGSIGLADPARPAIHLHGTLCDSTGKVWGGHFAPGGNPVHSTMDVVLTELPEADFAWSFDPEIDLEVPVPHARKEVGRE